MANKGHQKVCWLKPLLNSLVRHLPEFKSHLYLSSVRDLEQVPFLCLCFLICKIRIRMRVKLSNLYKVYRTLCVNTPSCCSVKNNFLCYSQIFCFPFPFQDAQLFCVLFLLFCLDVVVKEKFFIFHSQCWGSFFKPLCICLSSCCFYFKLTVRYRGFSCLLFSHID